MRSLRALSDAAHPVRGRIAPVPLTTIAAVAMLGLASLPGCGDSSQAATDGTAVSTTLVVDDGRPAVPPAPEPSASAGPAIETKMPNDQVPYRDLDRTDPSQRIGIDLSSYFDPRVPPLVSPGSADGGYYACHVDFNDSQAKVTAMWGAWMDRIYMPWWQSCTMGRIDVRPTVHEHVHLNFQTLDIVDCLLESPDGYPRRRVNGVCQKIDAASEPRTDISTHMGDERVLVRGYTTDTSQYQRARFDLIRLRVSGQQPVRLCYQPVTQNHSKCFTKALAPGYYDFSGLVTDAVKVEVSGATDTTFSLDDIRVTFGAALP